MVQFVITIQGAGGKQLGAAGAIGACTRTHHKATPTNNARYIFQGEFILPTYIHITLKKSFQCSYYVAKTIPYLSLKKRGGWQFRVSKGHYMETKFRYIINKSDKHSFHVLDEYV